MEERRIDEQAPIPVELCDTIASAKDKQELKKWAHEQQLYCRFSHCI